ncbi:MAG: hypothetical protein GXP45_07630 [bacterium]|nr:hypothetical protein [bacterium]
MGQITEIISSTGGFVFSINKEVKYSDLLYNDYINTNFGTQKELLSDKENIHSKIITYLTKTKRTKTIFSIWESDTMIIFTQASKKNLHKIIIMIEKTPKQP